MTFTNMSDAMKTAITEGDLDAVKGLRNSGEFYTDDCVYLAIRKGHLDILKHFEKECGDKWWEKKNVMDLAAKYGQLEILEHFDARRPNRLWCTTDGMDWAAENGHLDVVKFLDTVSKEYAASVNDAGINYADQHWTKKYIYLPGRGCTKAAVDQAAKRGHLEVVKYLLSIGKEGTPYILTKVAAKGYLEIVELLYNEGYACTESVMDQAARYNHLNIVKFCHETAKTGCTDVAMNWAARNGYLEIVKYLHTTVGKECTNYAMEWAAEHGHLEVVKYLHEEIHASWSEAALESAALKKHAEVVNYLITTSNPEYNDNEVLNWVIFNGYIEVAKFLCDTRGIEGAKRAQILLRTVKRNHLKLVDVLHHSIESPPSFALIMAAENEHRKIFDFLRNLATN